MGDAKDVFYFRRQVLGLLLAAGVLTGLWFSDYTLLLRRKWVPAAALLLFSLAPLWGLPFGWPFLSYKLMLYPTLLLPVPYAALVVSLRGRGTRAVLLLRRARASHSLSGPLSLSAVPAIWLPSASLLLVLLAAVGLGWFRGKRRWNLLAALGPALDYPPPALPAAPGVRCLAHRRFPGARPVLRATAHGGIALPFCRLLPGAPAGGDRPGPGPVGVLGRRRAGSSSLPPCCSGASAPSTAARASSSPCRPSFPCSSRRPSTGSITWAGGRWACSPSPSCPTASSSCWWTPPWRGCSYLYSVWTPCCGTPPGPPAPRPPGPPLWTSPWAGDSSTSNSRKGAQHFVKHTKEACGRSRRPPFSIPRPPGRP